MNVASLELCKELYEQSGWTVEKWYLTHIDKPDHVVGTAIPKILELDRDYKNGYRTDTPAYDLGYLLRKLPQKLELKRKHYSFVLTGSTSDGSWIADYMVRGWVQPINVNREVDTWLHHGNQAKLTEGDTPEDAACKLAIELFKQGLLKKEVM